ncbi:ankyrin repeat domain-containing protein [Pseudolysobacter antarcticus]|uniref:Ankyrin repeat domain-containing protein n=1 Tax=Pseudolysobacter antarcticus TaxID=2511995 RepID=A0A411HK16_9GAMM|nr:ankyrin repeat domain-containing protein [Pseudolysobacter antarcticus]QBB70821.1 ankyrin repeat domain-containing protein [Pseudolysobacter antarcticus]
MQTLSAILKRIGGVAEFSGIQIDGPNTCGLFNVYPLHVAAIWGDCEAIRVLVIAGARVNQQGEHGFTPLMEAVAQNIREPVELLISLGAEPLRNDDGQLPSEYAQIGGREELAALLRQHGF